MGIRYLYITAAVTGKKVETSKRKIERKNLKTKRLKFKKYTKRRFLVYKKVF